VRVTQLIAKDGVLTTPGLDPEIAGITADSRAAQPGYLFAALPGTKADGTRFIGSAIEHGVVAVLSVKTPSLPPGIAGVQSDNPRRALAMMAARFYGRQPRYIAAVTGTNGKTSIAHFTRLLWTLRGHKAASLGTLGLVAPDRTRYGTLTTADPVALHRDLGELVKEGVEHVAMEASSHGLDQFRLDGVRVRAAAFTNLTRDHLDYHATMEAYGQAKQRLFADVMEPGGTAVLNADVPEFAGLVEICRQRRHRILSYGRHGADIQIVDQTPLPDGQRLSLSVLGRSYDIVMPLVAEFQAMNAAAATGLVLAGDDNVDAVIDALTRLTPVPGRIELAATRRNGAGVYVDYAHTPDALETVLKALRPHARGKLVAVFGCGGDRDPGKRPMMGAIGSRLADIAIVTDDNPRTEDAALIRRQVMEAAPGAREIGSRRDAIFTAVAGLEAGDVLVVAGKGHEQGQIIGQTVHPFDDAVVAREAVAAADKTGGNA
jgi:UDP-N-acetylmuramoyl-L-alanyl-D-glutamate--2,6-diaminopimelate ligase